MTPERSIQERNRNRLRLLSQLYEATGGDTKARTRLDELAGASGMELADVRLAADYLKGEGLLEYRAIGGVVGITHAGVRAAEAAQSQSAAPLRGLSATMTHDSTTQLLSRVDAVLGDHLQAAHSRYLGALSDLVARAEGAGRYHSSMTTHQLSELATEEVRRRADIVAEAWRRILGAFGELVAGAHQGQVTAAIEARLSAEVTMIIAAAIGAAPKQMPLDPAPLRSTAELVRSRARQEFEAAWRLAVRAPAPTTSTSSSAVPSNRVFLVHGHDHGRKEEVARFLEKLDLDPIVLHEQPNEGQTIIEKFERHSEVGAAVVLLTADDVGGPGNSDPSTLKPRARQNVIFELGFFCGSISRKKVCVLYEDGVELPTDYAGILFTPLRDDWRTQLARELKAAGLPIRPEALLG